MKQLIFKLIKQNLICCHHVTGQIKSDKTRQKGKRHYRFCEKCGKRWYV